MHERNIFHKSRLGPPDFRLLSDEFPKLKDYIFKKSERGTSEEEYTFNFKDVEGLRLNYIHCIEDLLDNNFCSEFPINGLDIGTGATCIYPLLICKMHTNWTMTATDIDGDSIDCARKNIKNNHLTSRISITQVNKEDKEFKIFTPLLFDKNVRDFGIAAIENEEAIVKIHKKLKYSFTMCNPPFYDSSEEIDKGCKNKSNLPSGVCSGSSNEMITEGGEFNFISIMIKESTYYKNDVGWFTTMVGKKSTLTSLKNVFKKFKDILYRVNTLLQGNTTRWVISWTFHTELYNLHSFDKRIVLKRKENKTESTQDNSYSKKGYKMSVDIEINLNLSDSVSKIHKLLDVLSVVYRVENLNDRTLRYIYGKVNLLSWTRKWRRALLIKNIDEIVPKFQIKPFECKFTLKKVADIQFKTSLNILLLQHQGSSNSCFEHFESFCNHIRTTLNNTDYP
ncbi:hypothetical protein K502DRAFT_352380 [Neoconidiobolus thromboides FSU 785]|nr:hypothetical protein K502DRAFT_352380 [Neoconidiobolus thromboides FSU 785]